MEDHFAPDQMSPLAATPAAAPKPLPAIAATRPHHTAFWVTVAVVAAVASAVAAGGFVYAFFSQRLGEQQLATDSQISQLTSAKTAAEAAAATATSQLLDLQAREDARQAAADAVYQGWQTYTDKKFGVSWRYPLGWQVGEREAKTPSGKNSFCLTFDGPQTAGTLQACYRKATDATATSWNMTGLGFAELGKVNIGLPLGSVTLTEKTLFGEGGKVRAIIYAQNVADDETKFPARVSADGYFWSFVASGDNLTAATQAMLDHIIGSVTVAAAPSEGVMQ